MPPPPPPQTTTTNTIIKANPPPPLLKDNHQAHVSEAPHQLQRQLSIETLQLLQQNLKLQQEHTSAQQQQRVATTKPSPPQQQQQQHQQQQQPTPAPIRARSEVAVTEAYGTAPGVAALSAPIISSLTNPYHFSAYTNQQPLNTTLLPISTNNYSQMSSDKANSAHQSNALICNANYNSTYAAIQEHFSNSNEANQLQIRRNSVPASTQLVPSSTQIVPVSGHLVPVSAHLVPDQTMFINQGTVEQSINGQQSQQYQFFQPQSRTQLSQSNLNTMALSSLNSSVQSLHQMGSIQSLSSSLSGSTASLHQIMVNGGGGVGGGGGAGVGGVCPVVKTNTTGVCSDAYTSCPSVTAPSSCLAPLSTSTYLAPPNPSRSQQHHLASGLMLPPKQLGTAGTTTSTAAVVSSGVVCGLTRPSPPLPSIADSNAEEQATSLPPITTGVTSATTTSSASTTADPTLGDGATSSSSAQTQTGKQDKKKTRKKKTMEKIPILTVLSVQDTMVECQLETTTQQTKFKFDITDDEPEDVTNKLVSNNVRKVYCSRCLNEIKCVRAI